LTTVAVDRLFGELKTWLPGLIQEVTKRQSQEVTIQPQGPFEPQRQKVLCEQVMRLLGFDFEAGRLDVSTHPFCGGVPEDVRMTTRFSSHEFITSLFGTIHETGHGRYEQNRPREWLGQPASNARSMAIHESQSLFFEMQLGCHPGFLANLSPLIIEAFGYQKAFEPQALAHLLTRVKPGLIRVDADEVTYPAHIMLRYDIERQLIEGVIEAEDIPSLWDAQMSSLLDLDTRGNFKDGPLQDVHWPMGLFGYFPCYSMGAMYAAQWFASIEKAIPNVHTDIHNGNLQPIWKWLNENIWEKASFWPTVELAHKASGSELDLQYFKRHLYKRYLGETL
jgi:carboxypeptidase Taq